VWGFLQEDELSIKNLAIGNFDSAKKLNKHQQVERVVDYDLPAILIFSY